MKISGFIFAFYILFLSVEPGLKDIITFGQTTETCSCGSSCEPIEGNQKEKQTNKNDNTDNKACNPFQICNSCTVFTSDLLCLSFSPIIIFSNSYTNNKDKIPPQITLEFWQPPKIA